MTAAAPGRILRVLIVDDSPEDRHTYRRMLHQHAAAWQVAEAGSGEAAVAAADRRRRTACCSTTACPT